MVIVDIIMPIKNGLVTIEELKRDFPDVRIIAMSGFGGRFGKPDGVQHTLSKPFAMNEMLKTVKALV